MSDDGSSIEIIEVEHAWKYFELHSKQRMTLFNYFVATSGLIVAAIGASAQTRYTVVLGALGILLTTVSWIFWKLDQRMSFLVKHAEKKYHIIEKCLLKNAMIFTEEPLEFDQINDGRGFIASQWTVGRSFRALFLLMGLVGCSTMVFSALQTYELLQSSEKVNPIPSMPAYSLWT